MSPSTVCRRALLTGGAAATAALLAEPARAADLPGPAADPVLDWPQLMGGSAHRGVALGDRAITPATVSTLSLRWDAPVSPSGWAPATGAPVLVGDAVYVGGDGVARHDLATGEALWRNTVGGSPTAPAYAYGVVVAATTNAPGGVYGLDAATGSTLWRRRLPGSVASSPSILGTHVFVGTGEGEVLSLRLGNGSLRWSWTDVGPGFGVVSSPTVIGNHVIIGTTGNGRVTCLDRTTGAVLWQRVLHDGNGWTVDGFTIVADDRGRLYVPTVSGMFALDRFSGATLWEAPIGPCWRAPAISGTTLVVILIDGYIVGLDRASGAHLWRSPRTGIADISPQLATWAGLVAIGRRDLRGAAATLDLVGARTGALLRRLPLSGAPEVPMGPAIARRRIVVAQGDRLLCYGLD